MHIAVNTRFLLKGQLEGFGVYTHEVMQRMVRNQEDSQFDFYFDRPFDTQFIYEDNVRGVQLFPPARHPILFRIWYEWSLQRAVNRSGADVFFSPDSFMPLSLKMPSVITLHDVAYQRFPKHVSPVHLRYYRHWMPKFVERADRIVTVSEFSKREILEYFNIPENKVVVIPNGVDQGIVPMPFEITKSTRKKYADGVPYFVYVGAVHPRKNVAILIKSFDQFREQSELKIKLLIVGRLSWDVDDVQSVVESSPFKSDIHLIGHVSLEEKNAIVAAAFALINVSLYEGFGLPVIEAQACGVPVIASSSSSTGAALAEVGGDAVLQADPLSTDSIASAMMRITAEKHLAPKLVKEGLINAKRYRWEVAAESIFEVLREVVAKNAG